MSNESIDAVLEKVFKGSSISYKIESGKQVVLTLKSEQNAPRKAIRKQSPVLWPTGGEPLIGVTVRVEGENIGTATDIDGRFSLEAPVGAKSVSPISVMFPNLIRSISRTYTMCH